MIDKNEITKSPTEMLIELQNIALDKLNLNISKIKSFPKTPSHLTRRINGIRTNLREKGIEITIGKEMGQRIITIRKILSMPSMPSKTQDPSTKQEKNMDSKSNNQQKMSSKMPSNEIVKNKHKNHFGTARTTKTALCQQIKR